MTHTQSMRRLLLASTAMTIAATAHADDASDRSVTLDTITVSTTRTEQAVVDSLAGSSVVTDVDLNRFQPDRISGVLVAIPGLDVSEDGDDPASSINIRGLQDFGRVNVMIDGARQNFQRSDHGANGSFYLEPELIKQVDVVRGPVSTIYGSGAIGGVVNFLVKDANDIIEPGENWALQKKAKYNTNGSGILLSSTGAYRPNESIGLLANVVSRDHREYKDGGGDTVKGSNKEILSGLFKGTFRVGDGHDFALGYIKSVNDYTTKSVSTTAGLTARETEATTDTVTGKWHYDAPDNRWVDWSLSSYYTTTKSEQELLEGAGTSGSKREFRIRTYGGDFYNTSRFDTASLGHAVTYGVDFFQDKVRTIDNDPVGSADEFTPSGKRLAYGAFIQDQIAVNDWLEVIGALRFDGYELEGADIKSSGTRVSPKATIGITPVEGVQFYATYAEGYRAPAVTEVFNSGTHPVAPAFDILANADLKPETARNYEVGVNLKFDDVATDGDAFRAKATVFQNNVKNYIDADLIGFFPGTCFGPPFNTCGTFQYQNIGKARIEGVEVEATYDTGAYFAQVAYSHIRGDDLENDVPLNSVHPDKLVATVGARFLDERFTVGGRWTRVSAQKRDVDIPQGGHDPVDLFATYEHNRHISTALNINNVFDENYTKYLNLDASPGFSVGFSVTIKLGG